MLVDSHEQVLLAQRFKGDGYRLPQMCLNTIAPPWHAPCLWQIRAQGGVLTGRPYADERVEHEMHGESPPPIPLTAATTTDRPIFATDPRQCTLRMRLA